MNIKDQSLFEIEVFTEKVVFKTSAEAHQFAIFKKFQGFHISTTDEIFKKIHEVRVT